MDDVYRGEPFAVQRSSIGINGDQPLLAAIRERSGGSRYSRQLSTNKIVAGVEKLLLAEGVAGQADLDDRNGGSGIDDDQWRGGTRRQEAQESLRDSAGLRERSLDIGVRLEINLDHGNAI